MLPMLTLDGLRLLYERNSMGMMMTPVLVTVW